MSFVSFQGCTILKRHVCSPAKAVQAESPRVLLQGAHEAMKRRKCRGFLKGKFVQIHNVHH